MPSIQEILKSEIVRLARKEMKRELVQVRKQLAAHRATLAALKRQIVEVERLAKKRSRAAPAAPTTPTKTGSRFSAKGLKSLRTTFGLSAADMGRIAGVSGQSIYNYEAGTTRPRPEQLAALQALRGLGKKAALAKLATMGD